MDERSRRSGVKWTIHRLRASDLAPVRLCGEGKSKNERRWEGRQGGRVSERKAQSTKRAKMAETRPQSRGKWTWTWRPSTHKRVCVCASKTSPEETIHKPSARTQCILAEIQGVAGGACLGFLGLGTSPEARRPRITRHLGGARREKIKKPSPNRVPPSVPPV